jgi:hypothetical protein
MPDKDRPPDKTPWGHKDHEFEHIPGFTMVSTSGHGGLYLTAKQRAEIPEPLKQYSHDGKGLWWEEDCAWSLPVICLLSKRPQPSLSRGEQEYLSAAHEVAREYYPDVWENLTGRTLKPGQSEKRDHENYLIQRAGNLVVGTAWGSSSFAAWVPKGMVGVAAYPGKAFLAPDPNDPARHHPARYFLVPEKEYTIPFTVDPPRHQEVTGKDGVPPSDPMNFSKKEPREDPLKQIRDDKIRKEAEAARDLNREKHQKQTDAMRENNERSCQRWENTLNRMSPKNPIRIVGEFAYARLQDRQNLSLGRAISNSAKEDEMIIDKARAADEALHKHQFDRSQNFDQEKLADALRRHPHDKSRDRDKGPDFDH